MICVQFVVRITRDINSLHEWTAIRKKVKSVDVYEGWNFNSGNYLFTTDTK